MMGSRHQVMRHAAAIAPEEENCGAGSWLDARQLPDYGIEISRRAAPDIDPRKPRVIVSYLTGTMRDCRSEVVAAWARRDRHPVGGDEPANGAGHRGVTEGKQVGWHRATRRGWVTFHRDLGEELVVDGHVVLHHVVAESPVERRHAPFDHGIESHGRYTGSRGKVLNRCD